MASENLKQYNLRNRRVHGTPQAVKRWLRKTMMKAAQDTSNPLLDQSPDIKVEENTSSLAFDIFSSPTINSGSVVPPSGSIANSSGVISTPTGEKLVPTEEDSNPNPWNVVSYGRRSRSPQSVSNKSNKSNFTRSTVTQVRKEMHASKECMIRGQDTPIGAAVAQLDEAQQDAIQQCMDSIKIINDPSDDSSWESESQQEGPSSGKGKVTDPCNWGAAQLSEDDLDPEGQ
ncbi:hypothetical protein EV421DRAFT_1917857 [Armillaria borealis]|uniref:Uncharacterized protein n=1 Tax=Armillaria borealis TaxID=47425 RepID=A0AA39IBQ2_9AGAR|nr:hypothetical protein EV421DRAFT_1917857 [Armillaria borealis]